MNKVRPKKSLGQHFLKDLSIAEQIADTLMPFSELPILEVGPGMGVLTDFLLEKYKLLKVIEIDRDSVPYLHNKYPEMGSNILEGDFLQIDISTLFPSPFCVIGNYPYNISSQIFFKVLEYKHLIPCCSGMIQREVGIRLAAKPGNKDYGILSVLIQAWYDVEYLFTVSEHVFDPPPKVKSAVVRLTRNKTEHLGCDERFFKTVVKTAFNQRRKTMRNSLRQLCENNTDLLSAPIFDKRPEQISVNDFIELTNRIQHAMKQGDE